LAARRQGAGNVATEGTVHRFRASLGGLEPNSLIQSLARSRPAEPEPWAENTQPEVFLQKGNVSMQSIAWMANAHQPQTSNCEAQNDA